MKKLILILSATATLFSACTMQKVASNESNINYDDAYFEPSDLESHPIYSAPDPLMVAEKKAQSEGQINNQGTRSYGQSYRDRMSNFNNYQAPCNNSFMFGSNPYRNNLMMYNLNQYLSYGPGMYSMYSPYSGCFNNMYSGGFNCFYDPNWVFYNQMFYGTNPGMMYYGNFNNNSWNNNNWSNNSGGRNSTTPVLNSRNTGNSGMGSSNTIRNSQRSYNSSTPASVNNRQSGSTYTPPQSTRQTENSGGNIWRDSRSSSPSSSGGGTTKSSNTSGGGSGRRR